MPSVSESQRRLFGMVLAAKRGKMMHPSAKVKNMSAHMSESDVKDFASKKKKREGVYKSLMDDKED